MLGVNHNKRAKSQKQKAEREFLLADFQFPIKTKTSKTKKMRPN